MGKNSKTTNISAVPKTSLNLYSPLTARITRTFSRKTTRRKSSRTLRSDELLTYLPSENCVALKKLRGHKNRRDLEPYASERMVAFFKCYYSRSLRSKNDEPLFGGLSYTSGEKASILGAKSKYNEHFEEIEEYITCTKTSPLVASKIDLKVSKGAPVGKRVKQDKIDYETPQTVKEITHKMLEDNVKEDYLEYRVQRIAETKKLHLKIFHKKH